MMAVMSIPSTLVTLDSALNGRVIALLEQRRTEGRSASQIRDELRDEHGITVSERTVARWIVAINPDPGAVA